MQENNFSAESAAEDEMSNITREQLIDTLLPLSFDARQITSGLNTLLSGLQLLEQNPDLIGEQSGYVQAIYNEIGAWRHSIKEIETALIELNDESV